MTKHFAIDPNGKTHTRNSKTRTYSHTVVAKIDPVSYAADGVRAAKNNALNYDFYLTDRCYRNWKGDPETRDIRGKEYASPAEFQADYPTQDDFLESLLQDSHERDEAHLDEGYFDTFFNFGWTSRLDLAAKLAAKTIGQGFLQVTILEAQIK